MSRSQIWKPRLTDILEAITKIQNYSFSYNSLPLFLQDEKTMDACIRNLQIIGEASARVPAEVKKDHPEVPWAAIKGMRNILVHEYFGVSPSILWDTIQNELPKLKENLEIIVKKYDTPVHPWRVCPIGEYYVSSSYVDPYIKAGHSVQGHRRQAHCRQHTNLNIDTLSANEIIYISNEILPKELKEAQLSDLGFGSKGSQYDILITGWTKYWNDLLNPEQNLDADLVKALIASESSFNSRSGIQGKSSAKGLGQLMPLTIKSLQGFRKELKEYHIEINGEEIFEPSVNISATIRWLFHKQKMATRKLKRPATWVEAVEAYKNVLNKSKSSKSYKTNMGPFLKYLKEK